MAFKGNLLQLSDLFIDKKDRPGKAVYFIRINQFSDHADEIIKKCILKAQHCGILLDSKFAAPPIDQIDAYQKIVGDTFEISLPFLDTALAKWLPQVTQDTRNAMSDAALRMLTFLKKSGKNPNIIKNAFTKYMCWSHHMFLTTLQKITPNDIPVVIYDNIPSIYELQMLMIMCSAGCDVILLQNQDYDYQKIDTDNQYAQHIEIENGKSFPENYSIKSLVQSLIPAKPHHLPSSSSNINISSNPIPSTKAARHSSPSTPHPQSPKPPIPQQNTPVSAKLTPHHIDFGPEPKFKMITNSWCTTQNPISHILTPFSIRSSNTQEICNVFSLESGVNNVSTYTNDLYQFYRKMLENKRQIIIAYPDFDPPKPDEISNIRRGNYNMVEGMIKGLSTNIVVLGNPELQKLVIRAFGKVMLEYATRPDIDLPKATRTAICLIAWFRRCQRLLFDGWNPPSVACFIYFGACTNEKEALFLRMLSYMPVDVLILNPDLDKLSIIQDNRLKINKNMSSMQLDHFPTDRRDIRITTESYQAERELDYLSDDCGFYRTQQFKQAESFTLHTSYHEIAELWNTPISERPNFEIHKGVVSIPTLFAKISGVEQDKEDNYWLHVKSLITPNTHVIKRLPNMTTHRLSPIANSISKLYINHKLQIDRIKMHPLYPYTLLRPDMQNHIFNALETMLEKRIIRGPGEHNTDLMIIATALSLDKPIHRLLQQFDFTQKNPKLLILNTGETVGSIQDAIQFAFLNLIGFDILFFIPSGYQCIEQWYQTPLISEHHAGSYQYQYNVPDFEQLSNSKQSWFNRLIRN